MEEPDEDDGGVLQEGEPVVEHVFVTGAFLFGIEEHENVDDTWNVNLKNKHFSNLVLCYRGQGQRGTLHTECCRRSCAGRSPRRPSPGEK